MTTAVTSDIVFIVMPRKQILELSQKTEAAFAVKKQYFLGLLPSKGTVPTRTHKLKGRKIEIFPCARALYLLICILRSICVAV